MSTIEDKPFTALHKNYVKVLLCTGTNDDECNAFIKDVDNAYWINLDEARGQLLIKENNSIRYEPQHAFDQFYIRVS